MQNHGMLPIHAVTTELVRTLVLPCTVIELVYYARLTLWKNEKRKV